LLYIVLNPIGGASIHQKSTSNLFQNIPEPSIMEHATVKKKKNLQKIKINAKKKVGRNI